MRRPRSSAPAVSSEDALRSRSGSIPSDPVSLLPRGICQDGTGSVLYANTSVRSLSALRRVAEAVAESSPSPADMSGTRRLSHHH